MIGPIRVEEHRSARLGPAVAARKLYFDEFDTCHLGGVAYHAIARVAQPEGPNSLMGQLTVGELIKHTMTATFTYSRTASLLLELKQPTGEVVYRDPAYAGEGPAE